jgi:hypothetical protein
MMVGSDEDGHMTTTPDSAPVTEARKAFHEELDDLRADVIRLVPRPRPSLRDPGAADGDLTAAEGDRRRRRDDDPPTPSRTAFLLLAPTAPGHRPPVRHGHGFTSPSAA